MTERFAPDPAVSRIFQVPLAPAATFPLRGVTLSFEVAVEVGHGRASGLAEDLARGGEGVQHGAAVGLLLDPEQPAVAVARDQQIDVAVAVEVP